jgi:hypothetical protein
MKTHEFWPINLGMVLREKAFQGRSREMNGSVGDKIVLRAYNAPDTEVTVSIIRKLVGPEFGVSPGMTEYQFE